MTVHDIKRAVPKEATNTAKWQDISTEGMEGEEVRRIEDLRWAVEAHFAGVLTKKDLADRALHYQQVYRAVNRCTARWSDGTLVGWRGLIANLRVRGYVRRASDGDGVGKAGIFQKFLREHEDIRAEMDRYLLTAVPGSHIALSSITPQMAHKRFIALCDEKGLSKDEWPYNTMYRGRTSITKYVKNFYEENYDKIVYREYGDKARAKSKTGRGIPSRLIAEFPYEIWEIDEHKAHFVGAIGVQTSQGRRWVEIGRISIIAVVDRGSGGMMGYSIIYRREANAQDILNAIEHALGPWKLVEFTRKDRNYVNGAGFPSGCVDGAERCAPAVLLFDNALSHLAEEVSDRARKRLGCAISYGAVGRFERRSHVEGTFSDVERSGFMKLISTTGTGPGDYRRKKPEIGAVKMKTETEDCEELIETVLAGHNARDGSRNFGLSPNKEIDRVMSDKNLAFIRPRLPSLLPTEVPLSWLILELPVHGNKPTGVRPHINYLRVQYTNPELADSWPLVGTKLRVCIPTSNIRFLKAFDLNGVWVGELKAQGKWGRFDHSLQARELILAKIANNEILSPEDDDAVQHFVMTQENELVDKIESGSASTTEAASKLAESQSDFRKNAKQNGNNHTPASRSGRSASDEFNDLGLELPESVTAIN